MSFSIILLIMLACGLLGGFINYLLPANDNPDNGNKIRGAWQCVLMGVGATLLVPLFLEIAQSKLLDHVYFGLTWQRPVDSKQKVEVDTIVIVKVIDSAGKTSKSDTIKNKQDRGATVVKKNNDEEEQDPAKNYLLYAAYCLVAAAAGFKFINMLINNVVKEQTINKLQSENADLQKAKELREKNSQINQQTEELSVRNDIAHGAVETIRAEVAANPDAKPNFVPNVLPSLPAVIHPDDPQKGRFGGSPKRNGRTLKATVADSTVSGYYDVSIWVESDDPIKAPLVSDVIFYIHDSFRNSVIRVTPKEFIGDKAMKNDILSYGAFTVGAICDNGATLLELDLSEDSSFPKKFRER